MGRFSASTVTLPQVGPILVDGLTLEAAEERIRKTYVDKGVLKAGEEGEISAEERARVYYYTLFPGAFLSFHPDYVMVHRAQPLAIDRENEAHNTIAAAETGVGAPFVAAVPEQDAGEDDDDHPEDLHRVALEPRLQFFFRAVIVNHIYEPPHSQSILPISLGQCCSI